VRVFVAGATGALGRPVVRRLVAQGHDVVGLTRRAGKRGLLEAMGARPAVADALDAPALIEQVREARPTHVVHLLSALPPEGPLRASDLRATNVLRRVATAHLLAAAAAAGARRLVAESFPAVYGRDFASPAVEGEPLEARPPATWGDAVSALRSLEAQLLGARREGRLETVALRIAGIYGPDVASTVGLARRLRRRQVFVPTGVPGLTSFVHVEDAAAAVVAALEHQEPSLAYNVADDEPVSLADFLSLAAAVFGAPPPRRAPAWLLRLVAPLLVTIAAARLPLSNLQARVELGWRPRYGSVREGLPATAEAMANPRRGSVSGVHPAE
jgi:nucleoside-diphosphate-sugar epimerase